MTNHRSYHCSVICSKRDIALVRQRHQCNGLFPAVEASKCLKQCVTPADHILRFFFLHSAVLLVLRSIPVKSL
jgi:hypothetical protein